MAIGEEYAGYAEHREEVTRFYENSLAKATTLYIEAKNIGMDYFCAIAEQGDIDYDMWNDAMEDFYDTWNEGMEDFYDTWNDTYEDV